MVKKKKKKKEYQARQLAKLGDANRQSGGHRGIYDASDVLA